MILLTNYHCIIASGMVGSGLVSMLLKKKNVKRVVCVDIRPPAPEKKYEHDPNERNLAAILDNPHMLC